MMCDFHPRDSDLRLQYNSRLVLRIEYRWIGGALGVIFVVESEHLTQVSL